LWGKFRNLNGFLFLKLFINKKNMKKLFNLIKKLFKGSKSSTPTTYNVTFETDWTCDWCSPMIDPVITNNSVTFNSGRVVSTHGYKNISKITATIDLSKMAPNSTQKNNWLNASFYMVNSSIKPKGTSYCDAGNNGSPYCNEIDFLETNGNRIFQQTIHLNNQQRFEYSYTDGALDDSCYTPSHMSDDPSNGTHSLVDVLDVTIPFEMEIDFNSDYTNMTITVSQNGKSAVIYDVLNDGGADDTTVDMTLLKSTMSVGWWITPSYWEGYSPKGPYDSRWFTGECYSDSVCNAGWTLSNVVVVAESQI
jgi:hypothetical protein